MAQVRGIYYAQDEWYKPKWYEPIPLPLWETPVSKTKTSQPQHKIIKPKTHAPQTRKRQYQQPYSPIAPPRKRSKFNPNNPNSPKIPSKPNKPNKPKITQCFRCGRTNHHFDNCHAVVDVNGVHIQHNQRRIVRDMRP